MRNAKLLSALSLVMVTLCGFSLANNCPKTCFRVSCIASNNNIYFIDGGYLNDLSHTSNFGTSCSGTGATVQLTKMNTGTANCGNVANQNSTASGCADPLLQTINSTGCAVCQQGG